MLKNHGSTKGPKEGGWFLMKEFAVECIDSFKGFGFNLLKVMVSIIGPILETILNQLYEVKD